MQRATIVTLGKRTAAETATFEQAFGEHSNIKGRGRSRKARRKADKIQKKKEKKLARISARDEVKTARQETRGGRKVGKIARRTERKGMRLDRRDETVERNQARKDFKVGSKIGRKIKGRGKPVQKPREEEYEQAEEMDDQTQPGYSEQDSSEQGSSDESQDPQGEDSGSYADEESAEEESQEESEEDSYPEDEGEGDEAESEEDGDYIGEEEGDEDSEYYEEDSEFQGVMGAEDRFSELHGNQKVKVSKDVQDIADKIEWNKELVSRLRVKKAVALGQNQDTSDFDEQIISSEERIKELETTLMEYKNFEGKYSCADGVTEDKKKQRFGEVRSARGIAMGKRLAIGRKKVAKKMKKHGGDSTPVDSDLNPSFGKNRIVVPAKENSSNYTGLNSLDNVDDYDAPPIREITLGVDGKTGGADINWKGILIGTAIGIAAIWAIKKYKILQ